MTEWISVKDRLPEESETCDGRVAALDEDGVAMIGVLVGSNILTANGHATDWYPLPNSKKDTK